MQKTIRKFNSFDEMKSEAYHYWTSVTPEERILAAFQMSVEAYRALGYACDGSDLKKVAVRFERTPR
jgi:hypothetical protein